MQHEDSVRHFRRSLDRDWGSGLLSTKANAEDNEGGGVARFIRPAPVPPSAAPPERAIIIALIIGVTLTITIAAITESLTLWSVTDTEIWY